MTATLNGRTACTCLNKYDFCPACRAREAAEKVNPPAVPRPATGCPPKPQRRPRRPAQERPKLLTSQATARLCSIGIRTLWRLVERGQFPPPIRWTAKLIRWRRADVLRWVKGLTAAPGEGEQEQPPTNPEGGEPCAS